MPLFAEIIRGAKGEGIISPEWTKRLGMNVIESEVSGLYVKNATGLVSMRGNQCKYNIQNKVFIFAKSILREVHRIYYGAEGGVVFILDNVAFYDKRNINSL